MKIRCIDFETTDKPEARKPGHPVGVIEIGFTDVDDAGQVSRPVSMLVNPKIAISPEARGVHHISNAELEGAPPPDYGFRVLSEGMEAGDMFAAHNVDFERAFFTGGAFPWICTMKCAKHIWDDAPGYSNQTLRYWMDMEHEFEWPDLTSPSHRAGPDSYVTAHILNRMQLMKAPATLVDLTKTPVLLKNVQSGKYAGHPWSEMDEGYLRFILDPSKGPFSEEVLHTARYWLNKNSRLSGHSVCRCVMGMFKQGDIVNVEGTVKYDQTKEDRILVDLGGQLVSFDTADVALIRPFFRPGDTGYLHQTTGDQSYLSVEVIGAYEDLVWVKHPDGGTEVALALDIRRDLPGEQSNGEEP